MRKILAAITESTGISLRLLLTLIGMAGSVLLVAGGITVYVVRLEGSITAQAAESVDAKQRINAVELKQDGLQKEILSELKDLNTRVSHIEGAVMRSE